MARHPPTVKGKRGDISAPLRGNNLSKGTGATPSTVTPAWTAISLRDPRRTWNPSPSYDGCDDTRGPVSPLVKPRSRRPLPLFCLAPHRVFHAPSVTLGAVGSYPAFSPLPRSCDQGGLFSATLSVNRDFGPGFPRVLHGMLPYGVRTFLQDCSQRSSTVTQKPYA